MYPTHEPPNCPLVRYNMRQTALCRSIVPLRLLLVLALLVILNRELYRATEQKLPLLFANFAKSNRRHMRFLISSQECELLLAFECKSNLQELSELFNK